MTPVLTALVPGYDGDPAASFLPPHIRMALRASVALAHVYALWSFWRPFGRLDIDDREDVLRTMCKSSLAPVRGVVQWWKLVAMVTAC